MSDVDRDLLEKARSIHLVEMDLAACWQHVIRGIEAGWLDAEDVGELVHDLRDHVDYAVEELSFERRADRMHVILLRDDRTCDPTSLVRQLESLIEA